MPTFSELIRHKQVLASIAVVFVILLASVAYYLIESRAPALTYVPVARAAIAEDVTASGTVSPIQNPNLTFAVGGRVTLVNAQVGETVNQGTLLASLDTGVLSAEFAAAQAAYEGLAAGPRPVDLAGKQTAVATAQAALSNEYESLPSFLADVQAKVEDAVHSNDTLFGSLNVVDYPRVNFLSHDGISADAAGRDRGQLSDSFDAWNREIQNLSASSDQATLDAALADSITRMALVRDFFTNLSDTVNAADPDVSPAKVAALSAARATANAEAIALTNETQTISNERLAITAAQDALNLEAAGASTQDIAAAKAQADAAGAALAQAEIIAPFDGTVAAVSVKEGDVVTPNQPAISIIPNGKFEVDVYLSEIDMTKLVAGDAADVTLDAYGTGVVFPATVASIDQAPTMVNGVPSYKATLVFTTTDARVASGMSANATIHAGTKQDALVVPKGALINDANGSFVLKEVGGKTVKTPVTVGLVGSDTVEILSGLSEGDTVATVVGN